MTLTEQKYPFQIYFTKSELKDVLKLKKLYDTRSIAEAIRRCIKEKVKVES
jgi:hypothetical protein